MTNQRLVGQCFIADTDIGLAMVNAGLAESMLRYLPRFHSIGQDEYGEAENRARDRRLGIWSAEIESPHLYRAASHLPSLGLCTQIGAMDWQKPRSNLLHHLASKPA